jgi:toxin CcdB
MARLDVRRLRSKGRISLVVEIQSDYMRDLPTMLVAPVIAVSELKPYGLINPIVQINGKQMAVRLEQMAGVPVASLGDIVASLAGVEDELSVALHRLVFYV